MAELLLFAQAREIAGTRRVTVEADTIGAVVDRATSMFGPEFARLLPHCRIWRNGDPAESGDPVAPGDEVAILPPVSGG